MPRSEAFGTLVMPPVKAFFDEQGKNMDYQSPINESRRSWA